MLLGTGWFGQRLPLVFMETVEFFLGDSREIATGQNMKSDGLQIFIPARPPPLMGFCPEASLPQLLGCFVGIFIPSYYHFCLREQGCGGCLVLLRNLLVWSAFTNCVFGDNREIATGQNMEPDSLQIL